MRIAMMTNNYLPFIGGVPISVERLANGLRQLGHEVIIFAPEYENMSKEEEEGNGVIRYRSVKGKIKNGVVIPNTFDKKIKEVFRENRFDLIHVHHPMLIGNTAMHFSQKYKIPLVFTYHTKYEEYLHYIDTVSGFENRRIASGVVDVGEKIIPTYMKWYLGHCDAVFAPSKDMKEYIGQLQENVPIHILPTGLSVDAFSGRTVEAKELRRWHIEDKKYLFCTVSRLEKEKNQYFLIAAIARLREMIGDCFRMLFVGDGNEREKLENYSRSLGLENTIEFIGAVPNGEVKDYLGASDAFLFSSKSETQGIVLLEAMAAGLPVVAVDATGVRDVVKDMENGFIVPEDVEKFARAAKRLLSDQDRYEKLSRNAKMTAKSFDMEHIARQAERFYNEAIRKSRRWNYESCFNCGG